MVPNTFQRSRDFRFGSLYNTSDRTKVPEGFIFRMSNATCLDDIGEGCSRFGDAWARTGAHANDRGYGAFYAEFDERAEYLAVVHINGDAGTRARLYSIDATTGAWTAVVKNGSDDLDASPWYFAQYNDRIYAMNEVDGLWERRVGGAEVGGNEDDAWMEMKPEFVRGSFIYAETERPPYEPYTWPGGTTAEIVHSDFGESHTILVDAAPDANNRIRLHPREEIPAGWDADAYVVVTLPAALDLSEVDHMGLWMKGGNPRPPLDVTSETSRILFAVTEDAATPVTYDWVQSLTKARVCKVTEGYEDNEWWMYADFSNVADSDKNAVRRLVFGLQINWNWDFSLYFQELRLGGKYLLEGRASEFAIPYAFAYYNPTTKQLSPAVQTDLPETYGDGETSSTFLDKLGAWVKLYPAVDSGLNGQGYTKIRLYRRDCFPLEGQPTNWHYLGEVDNDSTPDVPSYRDSLTETELRARPIETLRFEAFEADLQPQAIWLWKQHLCLGLKTLVYFSFNGRPKMYLPPPEDKSAQPDEDIETIGRTLHLSEGQTEPAWGGCAQDLLYIFSKRSAYVMIGDSATLATYPRLLPGSRGVCGKRAFCRWQSGVVAAWADGLWYYECSRAFTGSIDQTYSQIPMTANIQQSWKDLFGLDGSGLTVASYDDNLWIFNNERYIRLTNEVNGERNWEEGTWPNVACTVPVQGLGFRVQLEDGRLVRVYSDENGDRYNDDLGDEVAWSITGRYEVDARRKPMKFFAVCEGTPTIALDILDGVQGARSLSSTVVEGRFWSQDLNGDPGAVIGVTISGVTGRDKVKILTVEYDEFEQKVN